MLSAFNGFTNTIIKLAPKMTLQETMDIPEQSSMDLSKVAALQQKRTLAFVNHFVITTVQFLNHFMKKCETKLMVFERKLEKVEAAMVLLEARLCSIPEVNADSDEKPQEAQPVSESIPDPSADQTDTTAGQPESTSEEPQPGNPTQSEPAHPEYDRFVKMVQVGVPLEAVKLKVSLEGLDPNILARIIGK